MREETGLDDLAEQFRRFAAGVRRDGAVRYARICEGIASDEGLLELVAQAPPPQRRPNILLAAVHYLLLSGADDPLAAYYPTVLAWRGADGATAADPGAADPFPPFATFSARHHDDISHIVVSRATQTNEVGRCSAILPALSTIAARAHAPLALVDVGAAAGLNLLFDRYAYHYVYAADRVSHTHDHAPGRARDDVDVLAGDPFSPVVLHCEVRAGRVPVAAPSIAARVGLDRRPVDVRDDDQMRWLLACQWPDHLDRFEVARRALALARSLPDPPVVRRGDAVEDLAAVVARLPFDAHLCVLHSWVAAYFTPDEQHALTAAIARLAETRPVSWLFAEIPYEVPGLPVPPPREKVRGATALVLVEQAPGRDRTERRLADMHSHGRWLHWYGASGASS